MKVNILAKLKQEIPNLTQANKKVADYILNEPMESAFSTIDKIAHSANVSTATVIRLATSLGFSSFSDFQLELRNYLKTSSPPLDKLAINTTERIEYKESENLTKLTNLLVENINETYNQISYDTIKIIANKIIECNKVFVCGGRSSYVFASYLNHNLERMFSKAKLIDPNPSKLPETFVHIGKQDVVILCSLSRYNSLTNKVGKCAKEKGSFVVVITDSYDSPPTAYADCILLANCKTLDFHNSMLGPIYLADVLINECINISSSSIKENLIETEKYINEFYTYSK